MSGGALKELQDRSQQLAMQDWGNAQQRMMQDKQFAYQAFANDFARRRQENQLRLQQLQSLANIGQQATGTLGQMRMNLGQQQAGYETQLGNAQAAGLAPGIGETIAGTIGNLANPANIGSLMGAFGGDSQAQATAPQQTAQTYQPTTYSGMPSGGNIG